MAYNIMRDPRVETKSGSPDLDRGNPSVFLLMSNFHVLPFTGWRS